ncbi:family 16 glycosylhydrolase [Paractinoplanes lichenicola]|uniref:Family 16 glycosylhydrolase n=1 Tax=Paractinoplanes lichenicola TaxID=2802976 RepID=A0ABS1VKM1_9ACTN|nr:family 16 glycosylhydrolase [Actinoplanes lichenicola]MBL7255248.1 family 16 glycosylhydrolase [Actinoplanes lichenicola]
MRWKAILTVSALTATALVGTITPSEAAAGNGCSNPVLATNLNGWGALDSGTVSRTAVSDVPGASWAFTTTGRAFWMPQLQVSAGQSWTVSAQDRLVGGSGTAKLVVEWYNSAGTYLSESAGTPTALSTTAWKPVTASVTAPSGAASAHVLQEASSTANGLKSTLCSYEQGAAVPGVPTAVSATVSGTSATLNWSPPASTGSSAITGYTYGRNGTDSQGTGPWSGTAGASVRSATFNLLNPGSTYQLSVAAGNAAGSGPTASVMVTIPAAGSSPSGQPLPVGDLAGWRQIFTEDFTNDVALGSWPGSYAAKFDQYDYPHNPPDTHGGGVWRTGKDVSVSGGTADYYLHSENGVAYSAAILPRTPTQTYGRYEVRFKVDPGMTGWNSAWLLWPDDDVWPAHGEIDWPEGALTGNMEAFMHYADANGGQDAASSGTAFASGWHTATTEWLPGSVKVYLDGRLIRTFTKKIPSLPMHWVLQSESGSSSRPTGSGHIKIDWLTIYTRA